MTYNELSIKANLREKIRKKPSFLYSRNHLKTIYGKGVCITLIIKDF